MKRDQDHPFMRPLWRRVALVAVCAIWAAWELYNGQTFWAMLAGGMGVYGAWLYLITYPKPVEQQTVEQQTKE